MDDETFPDYRAVKNGGIEMTQEKTICMLLLLVQKDFYLLHGHKKERCLGRF